MNASFGAPSPRLNPPTPNPSNPKRDLQKLLLPGIIDWDKLPDAGPETKFQSLVSLALLF